MSFGKKLRYRFMKDVGAPVLMAQNRFAGIVQLG